MVGLLFILVMPMLLLLVISLPVSLLIFALRKKQEAELTNYIAELDLGSELS